VLISEAVRKISGRDSEMRTSNERVERSATPNINVTPLIDILLVLLIIFMVITPSRPSRFRTFTPEPPVNDPRILTSPRTLIVEIDAEHRLKLIKGRDLIAEGSLGETGAVAARLAREFDERERTGGWKLGMENRPDIPADRRIEGTVFIRAPRSLVYGEVARVIDDVKVAGAEPIGLQTDELIN
jgi:biopolymer transport protein ExbD